MKKLFQAIFLSSMVAFAACSDDDEPKKTTPSDQTTPSEPVVPSNSMDNGPKTRTFDLDGVKFNMIKVEGGTFLMGAQSTDSLASNYDPLARDNESPVHSVTLSTYYIAEYETTCDIVRKAGITSGMGSESNKPIRNIYRKDVLRFVDSLNAIMHKNGQLAEYENFSLPTEAQWEYAARGGKYSHNYIYAGSNNFKEVAYCKENSNGYSFAKVGSYTPNELGLYDMSGNCFEMCLDELGDYSKESQVNPQGPAVVTDNTKWILRSGSFYEPAANARVTSRGRIDANTETNSFSARLALVCDK